MPEDKKQSLEKDLNNPESLKVQIQQYFTKDQLLEALTSESANQFQSYIETIIPSLSQDQKEKLNNTLLSFSSPL